MGNFLKRVVSTAVALMAVNAVLVSLLVVLAVPITLVVYGPFAWYFNAVMAVTIGLLPFAIWIETVKGIAK